MLCFGKPCCISCTGVEAACNAGGCAGAVSYLGGSIGLVRFRRMRKKIRPAIATIPRAAPTPIPAEAPADNMLDGAGVLVDVEVGLAVPEEPAPVEALATL